VVLLDLEGSGALTQWPDPRGNEARQPPFEIHLPSWATDTESSLSATADPKTGNRFPGQWLTSSRPRLYQPYG
jgi:hypothetical protein